MNSEIPAPVLRSALEAVRPGEVVLVDDLDWDMKTPCDDCPFKRTSPYHEGVASGLVGYIDSIQAMTFGHTCHKTDRRPTCDGPQTWDGRPKHCAGAVLMLLKTGSPVDVQIPMLQAAQAGKLDLADMTARANASPDVFTLSELLKFYSEQLGIRLRKRDKLAAQRTARKAAKAKRRRKSAARSRERNR